MKKSETADFLPLTALELRYKTMFQQNPECAFDEPRTFQEIQSLVKHLPDFEDLYIKEPSAHSPDDFFVESMFPAHMDVTVSRHLRYCPVRIHAHSFFEILFVLNGSCINRLPRQTLTMNGGDICIIAPGVIHSVSAFSDDSILINLLVRTSTFNTSFFGTLANKDLLAGFFSRALYAPDSESYLLFSTSGDSRIQNLFLDMYDEFHSDERYSNHMLNSMVTSFFIQLLRRHEQDAIVPNPSGRSIELSITSILNYIYKNFTTVTLNQLSSFFNYSERQMARILKDYTDKTFVTIVQDIKIEKARELLANPDISIQRITDMVGYTSTSHFYTIFKKYYGMTPTAFRDGHPPIR